MKFDIVNLNTEETDIQVIIEKINEVIDNINKNNDSIDDLERRKYN